MTTTVEPMRIGSELRRWRSSRRVSQYELALRAGTTQRHVSFIESGRSKPGRAIVARLAESLGLSLRERNALLQAAGYAPVYPESSLDAPALLPVREALTSIVNGHEPYPAMVLGNYGEVLAANSAIDVLTEGASVPLLQPPINLLRIMVHPDGMARRVENLGDWGRHIVANLHARAVRNPDPRLDELIVELSGYLAATPPTNDQLGFSVPLRLRSTDGDLRLITTLTWFATATDITLAELHLEAFLPADDESATILQARARRRDVRSARRVKTDRRPR